MTRTATTSDSREYGAMIPCAVYLGSVGLVIWLALLATGCAGARPPITPQPPPLRQVQATVRGPDGTLLVHATGILALDLAPPVFCENLDGRLRCPTTEPGGGWLTITADGYLPGRVRLEVDPNLPDVVLQPDRPPVPPVARVRVEGRRFVTADSPLMVWKGLTAFGLIHKLATGRDAEVVDYLARAQAADVTVVRVFTMAGSTDALGVPYLFRLPPEVGRLHTGRLLQLAREAGVYVSLVVLVDTRYYDFDHRQHVAATAQQCALYDSCLGLDLSNEAQHATQVPEVGDPAYLMGLRALVPAGIPVALGAAHGSDDESRAFVGGTHILVHGDRNDGCGGDDRCWRSVRHTNEQRALSEEQQKPVVNDEPSRTLQPDQHLGMALLCRLFGLGDTFHYAGGLQGDFPSGAELVAFEARRRGWAALPADWQGAYKNVGHHDSPVTAADWSTVVRVYSAIRGNEGYTLALGIQGEARFEWSGAWPHRELLVREGGAALWRVSR